MAVYFKSVVNTDIDHRVKAHTGRSGPQDDIASELKGFPRVSDHINGEILKTAGNLSLKRVH